MEKGSSSSSSSSSAGPDSLNGLKFGKKIYFGGVASGLHPKNGGPPPPQAALPPSPAKKGRTAVVQGGQPPRCQVEGCRVDLSDAKAYYSRHKVCGMHSKSPKVIVSGLEQRFCQQCSRFHQLPEFDQGKRSCRRRLAGHNERRRKPPASSLMSSRYGSLSPSIFDARSRSGGFVMDFSTHPTFPGNQASITGKYHPPLQSSSQHPLSHHLLQGTTSSGGCYNDSTNALSLLSTQPWGPRTRSTSLGATHYLGTDMAHPSINHGMTIAPFAYNHAMHEMPPDLGHGQNSHGTMNEFTGELGLGQPNEGQFHELVHSRGYDASLQHMNWSL